MASSTIIDIGRLALAHGEGASLNISVTLGSLELAGEHYAIEPDPVEVRLDVSRPSRGYAFRLRFPVAISGPCMRCLEPARVRAEVEAREVDQRETDDEDLQSPYVNDAEQLDLGRWAHDAAILALPQRILCRAECTGLCPVCGESLNDAGPVEHEHESGPDPRWAKLKDLELD